jgi:hypothetical protein
MLGLVFFCISSCIASAYASFEDVALDNNKNSSSNIFPNIPINHSSFKTQDENNNRDIQLAKRDTGRKRVKFPKLKFSRTSLKKYLKTVNDLHKKTIANKQENLKSASEKQFFSQNTKNKDYKRNFFGRLQSVNLKQIIKENNQNHLNDIIDNKNIQEVKNISDYINNS